MRRDEVDRQVSQELYLLLCRLRNSWDLKSEDASLDMRSVYDDKILPDLQEYCWQLYRNQRAVPVTVVLEVYEDEVDQVDMLDELLPEVVFSVLKSRTGDRVND